MNRWFRPVLLATLLLPSAAFADYPFILPSSTSLSGNNNTVTFDAAGSDHLFFFDHRPIQLSSIKITKPDGTAAEPTNALQARLRSVFDLKLDQQGTWKVASDQTIVSGTVKIDGEERRVGGARGPGGPGGPGAQGGAGNVEGGASQRDAAPRGPQAGSGVPAVSGENQPRRQPPIALQDLPAGATDLHLTEMVRTAATFVTAGAPTTTVFKPTGKGLEFEPITHPNALAAGETARFRFLIDGKPAAGIKVTALAGGERYRDETQAMELTTGSDGSVAITWPAAGMYWLGAEAEDKKPSEKRAETRKMSFAATLEVMTP